jgi:hypothetical protein
VAEEALPDRHRLQHVVEEAEELRVDPIVRPTMTRGELERLLKAARFRCPKGRVMEACEGSGCPVKKGVELYGRCCSALAARLRLKCVVEGETKVEGGLAPEELAALEAELAALREPRRPVSRRALRRYLKAVERKMEGIRVKGDE